MRKKSKSKHKIKELPNWYPQKNEAYDDNDYVFKKLLALHPKFDSMTPAEIASMFKLFSLSHPEYELIDITSAQFLRFT